MAVNTLSNISALGYYIQRKGLEVAKPKLIYNSYGRQETIPQKNSRTIKFRRYERFAPTTGYQAAATRLLVEGTVPTDAGVTPTDVTLTLNQYGFLVRWTDVVTWTVEVPPDQELMARNSENMAQTMECVTRDGIQGGTNLFRLTDSLGAVSGANRTDVVGRINAVALDKAIRNLELSDAEYFTEMVSASNKIGTSGVRPSYIMQISPQIKFDLEQGVAGFKAVPDYGGYGDIMVGEVGNYKNIRFVMSTLAKIFQNSGASASGTGNATSATLCDVHSATLVGKNAYAVVNLASASEIKYTPPTSVDHSNPLGQWASLGWKAMGGSVILNDNWILRFETAVSA